MFKLFFKIKNTLGNNQLDEQKRVQMDNEQETTFQVKPEVLNEEKFKRQADLYLSQLEAYKKLDKEMKQYESNIKEYMVKNDLDIYFNDTGRITIDYCKVNCLNRALIDDIKQYYEETTRTIMRKTLNSSKPTKTAKN